MLRGLPKTQRPTSPAPSGYGCSAGLLAGRLNLAIREFLDPRWHLGCPLPDTPRMVAQLEFQGKLWRLPPCLHGGDDVAAIVLAEKGFSQNRQHICAPLFGCELCLTTR